MSSLDGPQTLDAKLSFERLALAHGVVVRTYQADNGRFSDPLFQDNCKENRQTITFCGVDAHHQNGIAERHICTLTDTARALLLHA